MHPFDMSLLDQLAVASVALLVGLFWASVLADVWAWLHRNKESKP